MSKRMPLWLSQLYVYRYHTPFVPVTLAHSAGGPVLVPTSDSLQRGVGARDDKATGTSATEAFERLKRSGHKL